MTDKPKRKRSERVTSSDKRRVRWLTLLYCLLLLPALADIWFLVPIVSMVLLAIAISIIGSYFITMLGKRGENLLTNTAILLSMTASTFFAWISFTIPVITGFITFVSFIGEPFPPSYVFPLSVLGIVAFCGLMVLILCFAFALEVQIQLVEWMYPRLNHAIESEKLKNDYSSSLSGEVEEQDIPLELLAESESTEQAQR
jgi:hypothetical protein